MNELRQEIEAASRRRFIKPRPGMTSAEVFFWLFALATGLVIAAMLGAGYGGAE